MSWRFFLGAWLLFGCGARTSLEDLAPELDLCDGVDQDGDGVLDEDTPPVSCGLGACRVEVPGCIDGAPNDTCTPLPPSEEICNGIDDDCDGAVDDGLPWGPLGEPVTVWSASPEFALQSALVPTDTGFLLIGQRIYDGITEITDNLLVQRLDPEAQPLESPRGLGFPLLTNGPRHTVLDDGSIAIAFCALAPNADTVAYAALLSSEGEVVIAPTERLPSGMSCGAMAPDIFFDGRAVLTGWTDNRADTYELLVDVATPELTSQGGLELNSLGDLSSPPRFTFASGRTVFVAGVAESASVPAARELRVYASEDPVRGFAQITRVELEAPDDLFSDPYIVPSSTGFIVYSASRFGAGLYRFRIATDGDLLEPLGIVPGTELSRYDLEDLKPLRGGGAAAGGYRCEGTAGCQQVFLVFDDNGEILHEIIDEDRAVGWIQSIAPLGDGRIAVSYPDLDREGEGLNEQRVRFFGCTP